MRSLADEEKVAISASGETPRPHVEEESLARSRLSNAKDGDTGSPSQMSQSQTTSQEQQQLPQASDLTSTAGVSYSPTNAFSTQTSQQV